MTDTENCVTISYMENISAFHSCRRHVCSRIGKHNSTQTGFFEENMLLGMHVKTDFMSFPIKTDSKSLLSHTIL